jgi:formamidopyrimidine-DNA glycosylase
MPELPDLTVFAESLGKKVLNRKISAVEYHRGKRLNVEPQVFYDALKGQQITRITRAGKALVFDLGSGEKILIHLMLSGGFEVCQANQEVPSAVLTVAFEDGQSLVLFDQRGLATITLNPDLSRTAVDALEVTSGYLKELFKKKAKLTIKELLIDQSSIAGIGNAYSDEILWEAKIAPKSIVGKIPEKVIDKLVVAIHHVLKSATDYIRQTNPGIMSGEVREHLAVHKPKAKFSPTGADIVVEQVASKKTYSTKEQILYSEDISQGRLPHF